MFGTSPILNTFFWTKDLSMAAIVYYIILIVGLWKIFEKAGEEGWKALIPFYNFYILFKIAGVSLYFWIMAACGAIAAISAFIGNFIFITYPISWILTAIASIVLFMMWNSLSQAFGHSLGFALGLWLLNPIFILVLGFGASQYRPSYMIRY